MNKYFIILLSLIVFGCEKSKDTNINKIVIHSVNLDIDTSFDVGCKDFELTFKNEIKVHTVTDKSILSKFEALLKKATISKKSKPLDVRRKIVVYYDNNFADTLYVDRINIMINNQMINENNDLVELALKL